MSQLLPPARAPARWCALAFSLVVVIASCDKTVYPTSSMVSPHAPPRGAAYSLNVANDRDRIGVNVNSIEPGYKIAALSAGQIAGVTWARATTSWAAVEPSNGTWDYAASDSQFNALHSYGFKVLAVLSTVPYWANLIVPHDSGQTPPTAAHYADWSTFVSNMVSRYSGSVDAWEVFNEPNCSDQFRGTTAVYDSLAARAVAIIAAAGKTAVLGGIATGEGIPSQCGDTIAQKAWLSGRLSNSYATSLGAVGLHRYAYPESAVAVQVKSFLTGTWTYSTATGTTLPFWLTEAGHTGYFQANTVAEQEVNAIAVNEIIGPMVADTMPNYSLWQKTFFWHLYDTYPGDSSSAGVVLKNGSAVDTTRAYHLLRRLTQGCSISGVYYRCMAVHQKYGAVDHLHLYSPVSFDADTAGYFVDKYATFFTSPSQIDASFHSLVRCKKSSTFQSSFVTQNWNCDGRSGYSPDRIIGFASDSARDNLWPLWRLYNTSAHDYFMTTDTAKKATLLSNQAGWVLDSPNPIGYVWRRGGSGGEDEP